MTISASGGTADDSSEHIPNIPIRKMEPLRLDSQGLSRAAGNDARLLIDNSTANTSRKASGPNHIPIPLSNDNVRGYNTPCSLESIVKAIDTYRALNKITVHDTLEYYLLNDLEDVLHSYIGIDRRAASPLNADIDPLTRKEKDKYIYPITAAIGRAFALHARDGWGRHQHWRHFEWQFACGRYSDSRRKLINDFSKARPQWNVSIPSYFKPA